MSCHMCEDDYGISICGCSYPICLKCAAIIMGEEIKNNYEPKKECPQCKKPLQIKYFTSGKMGAWNNEDLMKRVIVLPPDLKKEDLNEYMNMITHDECGNLEKYSNFNKYKDYLNLKKDIKPIIYDTHTLITGPGIFLNKDCEPEHGFWGNTSLKIPSQIKTPFNFDIIRNRNEKMIEDCEVFALAINTNKDCYYSLQEWGYAKALKKILIITHYDFEDRSDPDINTSLSEFYMFALDSINSFKELNFMRKEAIIKLCPYFNDDYTYSQYRKEMNRIINSKRDQC